MTQFLSQVRAFAASESAGVALRVALTVLVGLLLARIVHRQLNIQRIHPQYRLLLRRVATYTVLGLTFVTVLRQLGVDLSVLLGAAGVLTVAVGFASQTSMSNLISGLFLMGERPFRVGDVISVSDKTGEVISIDLLSVKLRTFDNLLVRLPNESMLKTNVTNLTHFPIRRYDLKLGVAYKEDLGRVREVLFEVADRNPLCLDEPAPLMIFLGFADSAQELQLSVWATRENFLKLRNSISEQVKRALDAAGIEIPFPHRTLYAGSATAPLPVRVIDGR